MIVLSYPMVIKYGWDDNAFHDMAIIDAPRPYILYICTSQEYNYELFKRVLKLIEKYSQK